MPVQAKLFGVRISTTVLSGQENGRGVSRDDQRVRESGAAAFDELKVRVFQSPGALIRRDEKAHIWDIEDLKYAAEEHEACTFYDTKELYKDAEIV